MNKKMMRTLYICYNDITEKEFQEIEREDEKGIIKKIIEIMIFTNV